MLRHTGVQASVPRNTLRMAEAWSLTGEGLAGDVLELRPGRSGRVEGCRGKDFPGGHGR